MENFSRYETLAPRGRKSVFPQGKSIDFVLYGSDFPERGQNPLICETGRNGGVEVPTDDDDDIGLF